MKKEKSRTVAIQSGAVRLTTKFTIGRTDRTTTGVSGGGGILESDQLSGTKSLVMDLGRGLDEVLEVGSREEIT